MRHAFALLLSQALLWASLCTSAWAADGVQFTARLSFDGPNTSLTKNEDGSTEDMEVVRTQTRTEVEGWSSGDSLKIVFLDSNDPAIHIGSWMVSTDGGASFLLVNPENKTFAKARFDAYGRASDAVGKKIGKWLKSAPKNLEVMRDGAPTPRSVAGVAGTAHTFTTTYETTSRLPGSKQGNATTVHHELVTAPGNSTLGLWLTTSGPATGHKDSDAQVADAYGLGGQIALYSSAVVSKGNEAEVERYHREITDYTSTEIPPSTFDIPDDYKKTNRLWSRIKPGESGLKGLFKKDPS